MIDSATVEPNLTPNASSRVPRVLPRMNWVSRLARPMRALGPYAAIELIVPGGSLLALSLWALRHRAWLSARVRRTVVPAVAPGGGVLPVVRHRRQRFVGGQKP